MGLAIMVAIPSNQVNGFSPQTGGVIMKYVEQAKVAIPSNQVNGFSPHCPYCVNRETGCRNPF